jgi:trk system potassium uptake protein TrkA
LGASIANQASERGDNVIAVDLDSASFDRLADDFAGFKVTGDATDISFLEKDCYLKTCKEAVVTTGDDNVNLFLAHMFAQLYGIPRVFVRFDVPEKSSLIAGIASIKAIYPFKLSLDEFKQLEGEGKP